MTRNELSEKLKEAEIAMLQAKRNARPTKDSFYPGTEDRDVEMAGRAAKEIAQFHHLERLWQLSCEESNE